MIICSCKNLSETEIKEKDTDAGQDCGQCIEIVNLIKNQKELDCDARKILIENLWNLYE